MARNILTSVYHTTKLRYLAENEAGQDVRQVLTSTKYFGYMAGAFVIPELGIRVHGINNIGTWPR